MDTKIVHYRPGVLLGGINCLLVFRKYFFFLLLSILSLKISLKFMCIPP